MQSRLHRAYGYPQDIGYLSVLQALIISEDDYLSQKVRKLIYSRADAFLAFLAKGHLQRAGTATFQQFEQAANFPILQLFLALIKAQRLMPAIAAHRIDRLMCCDRVEPGPNRSAKLILVTFYVKLQEGVLKDILGQVGIPKVTPQVSVKLPFVSLQ